MLKPPGKLTHRTLSLDRHQGHLVLDPDHGHVRLVGFYSLIGEFAFIVGENIFAVGLDKSVFTDYSLKHGIKKNKFRTS